MINKNNEFDLIVIGGGASGMFAAIHAGKTAISQGKIIKILIIEKNVELGKKLKITGGGRCNITNNNPDFKDFVSQYKNASKYLWTPFSIFGVKETFDFFTQHNLNLIEEDNFRVFPITQKAISVFEVLMKEIIKLNIDILYNAEVEGFVVDDMNANIIKAVNIKNKNTINGKNFVLSTGGASHKETGSDGAGFRMLSEIGHKVKNPDLSLVPLTSNDEDLSYLSGTSFDNINFKIKVLNKIKLKTSGKVLITHFGLSGPAILGISRKVKEFLAEGETVISLDLLPQIAIDKMDHYLLDIISQNLNKKIKNLKIANISNSIWNIILKRLKIDSDTELNNLKKEYRINIGNILKNFDFVIDGTLGYDNAIISSGGLCLDQVDFKTMQSKLYHNLAVTGDILDIDRPSGGFSLQLCWSTGAIAGVETAKRILS